MAKETIIKGEGENFPQLTVLQMAQGNGIDLIVTDETGKDVGTVVIDYFYGRLRVFVYMPEDEEPTHTVHIRNMPEKGEKK